MQDDQKIERLDCSKPPPGYRLHEGEDCNGESPDMAGVGDCLPTEYWSTWYWVLDSEDDAGPTRRTESEAIADAWADRKAYHAPPSFLVTGDEEADSGDGGHAAWLLPDGLSENNAIVYHNGFATTAEARAAAWAWHDRRHALAERSWVSCRCIVPRPPTWPDCLAWSDDQVAAVERWLVDSTAEMPEVLRA